MDLFLKGILQGSIPTVVIVGGTHHFVKKFRESKPVLYWGSLLAATGLTYAVVMNKVPAPFMNAETEEITVSCDECGSMEPYRQCKSCEVVRCEECESIGGYGIDYHTGLCRECDETFGAESDDMKAVPIMWDDYYGDDDGDNNGKIYGISYTDGYEVLDMDWFATAKERDAEIAKYKKEFGAEKMSPCCEEPLIEREGIFCGACGENYGFSAETFEAQIGYDGARGFLSTMKGRIEGANEEGYFPADEEDFQEFVLDTIEDHIDIEDWEERYGAETFDPSDDGMMMKNVRLRIDEEGTQFTPTWAIEKKIPVLYHYDDSSDLEGIVEDMGDVAERYAKEHNDAYRFGAETFEARDSELKTLYAYVEFLEEKFGNHYEEFIELGLDPYRTNEAETYGAEYTVEIEGFTNGKRKRIRGTEQELKDRLLYFHDPYDRMIDYRLDHIEDEDEAMRLLTEKWNKFTLKQICDNDDMLTLIETKEAQRMMTTCDGCGMTEEGHMDYCSHCDMDFCDSCDHFGDFRVRDVCEDSVNMVIEDSPYVARKGERR